MVEHDLRSIIRKFEEAGELIHIEEELDPCFEIAAALLHRPKGPTLYFDRVKGYSSPVIGNLLNTRNKYGLSLGITKEQTFSHTVNALSNPIKPQIVADGVCQEVVIRNKIQLRDSLPICTYCEKERNPYITAGILVAKDPETGARNISFNRAQVRGPNELMVGMSPNHHLYQLLEKAESRGEKLPVAITIGNHPAVLIAAATYADLGFDEFEIAGGLIGEPVKLVKGKTVNIEIPAFSEIIIEGEIDPGRLEEEGPFGEYSGHYESYGKSPLMSVTAITHRHNPIYQAVVPSIHPEHLLLSAIPIEATIFQYVKKVIPGIKEVVVTEGGGAHLHIIISLSSPRPGEGKKAIFAVFANLTLAKMVVAVDYDVNPRDPLQVERAIANRMRADRDIFIIPGVRTDRSDPLEESLTVAKMGIDATKPHDLPSEMFDLADVPRDVKERIARRLEAFGI